VASAHTELSTDQTRLLKQAEPSKPFQAIAMKCNYRIIESFRLERTFKITESNHKPNTVKSTTKPCPSQSGVKISCIFQFPNSGTLPAPSLECLIYPQGSILLV